MPESGPLSVRLIELRRRWDEDPSSRVFLQLAEEYRRVGESEEALKVLRAGLERNPGDLSAQVALGRCLLDAGQTQEALGLLDQVLERDPTQLVANKLAVEAHLRRGDALRARRQLESYVTLSPADPEIDTLRQRIDSLLLEDAAPVEPSQPMAMAPEPPDALPATARDEEAPSLPSGASAASPKISRGALDLGPADPFPFLSITSDRGRYLDGLSREGLFHAAQPSRSAAPAMTEEAPTAEEAQLAEETPPMEAVTEMPEEPAVEVVETADEDETLGYAPTHEEVAPPAPEPISATLGELYLAQGHHAEAERIFEAVLQQDPANEIARAGLARLQVSPVAEEPMASWEADPEVEAAPSMATLDETEEAQPPMTALEVEPAAEVAPAAVPAPIVAPPARTDRPATTPARKMQRLRRYLSAVRAGAERDVS